MCPEGRPAQAPAIRERDLHITKSLEPRLQGSETRVLGRKRGWEDTAESGGWPQEPQSCCPIAQTQKLRNEKPRPGDPW